MNVVFDTGVIIAAIYWQNEPRRCLAAFARRRFRLFATDSILDEYERVALELKVEESLTLDPVPALAWIQRKAQRVLPVRLPRPTCRDPQDDKFLECALAAQAKHLVSRDRDLLVLEKPFGIQVVTPRRFLSLLTQQHSPRAA
ncbi:MAG: putative toxin-antitoxin system toxin component, PIN family [Verrucomicrobiales bacterium]|nr:putative toxin-antitoxin system toxin component, PIN family [Verrucomicrobiales bacterium]